METVANVVAGKNTVLEYKTKEDQQSPAIEYATRYRYAVRVYVYSCTGKLLYHTIAFLACSLFSFATLLPSNTSSASMDLSLRSSNLVARE